MESMTLEILDPVVHAEVERVTSAPRLPTLDGKVVGLYSNNKTNATEILDMVGDILDQSYDIKSFVRQSFSIGGDDVPEQPCDVAVLAIGD
jgi:hypothetical protein